MTTPLLRLPLRIVAIVLAFLVASVIGFSVESRAADSWSAPVDLSAAGQAADSPQIASWGNAQLAVWRRSNGVNFIVQSSRSTDAGSTWTSPADLSFTGQDASAPQVAMDGSTAVAAWTRSNGANPVVQTARSGDGGLTWSAPITLSTAGQSASFPQLAMSGTDVVVTWYRSNGSNFIVQVAHSGDGGSTWATPTDLSVAGQSAVYPEVAMSGSTAIVTWYRWDGTNQIVQAARSSDAGATWSASTSLSAPGGDAFYPSVALAGSTAMVTWRRFNGANTIVQVRRSGDGGSTWDAAADLSAVGLSAASPRVSMSGAVAVVSWRRLDGANFIAQAARSRDAGLTWSSPVSLSASGRDVTAPRVFASGSTVLITWYRSNGTNQIVQVTRSADGGASWDAPIDLSASGQNGFYPQLTVSSGVATVIWYRSNGTHYIVQAAKTILPGASSSDSGRPRLEFTFVLPDGRECSQISPRVVDDGTYVQVPGADVDCRTPGSVITGWSIPGQSWAFTPGQTVYVVDSQVFTVVLREPVVRVILDANVRLGDSCVPNETQRSAGLRTLDLYLQRPRMAVAGRAAQPAMGAYPAPSTAPCTPPGYSLSGWNTRRDGSGTIVAPGISFAPVIGIDDNVVRMYAMWQHP